MKIGYLFPVAIILSAVVLLAWFIVGGYAIPDGRG
ncbi:TPA: YoaK family small membrane protein [Serratia marcescens]